MSYIDDHRASGFRVGDTVKVFAMCRTEAGGWNNSWPPLMNEAVGNTHQIISDDGDRGFGLETGFSYPWFVLEKVND